MERLDEDEDVDEGAKGGVTYPGKGQDYVVLPTSDKPEPPPARRRWIYIVVAIIIFIIIVICISVVIVFTTKSKDAADDHDISSQMACTLAGPLPTKDICERKGCEYYETPKELDSPSCVYPAENNYKIETKQESGSQTRLKLKWKEDNPPKDNFGILNVAITEMSASVIRLQIGTSEPEPRLERAARTDPPEPSFIVTTSAEGDPFSFSVTRRSNGEVIFDTGGSPLVYTSRLIEISGAISPDSRVQNDGRWLDTHDDTIVVWHSSDNVKLPYFCGVGTDSSHFGVAMNSSYPMRIQLGKEDKSTLVRFAMLGGGIDLYVMAGPSLPDLTTQFVEIFGEAYIPPYWSLGSLLVHNMGRPLTSEEYPVDGLVLLNSLYDGGSSDIKHLLNTIKPTQRDSFYIGGQDPAVKTAKNEVFQGTTVNNSDSEVPGQFQSYIDYTAELSSFRTDDQSVYVAGSSGYNLVLNYPSNYVNECEDNDDNNPPYFNLTVEPLYKGTLCLDFVHEGGTHNKIHNIYGHLQSKVLSTFANSRNESILQFSDSVYLGSGKYTAKTITVKSWEDLKQVIPQSTWYGKVGMNVVCMLDEETEDKDLILKYHQLIAFLPISLGSEAALAKLDEFQPVAEFMLVKYTLYPEWMAALYQAPKEPIVRDVSYNFPDDDFLSSAEFERDFHEYMIGDKILVAPLVNQDNQTKVYLPPSAVWYQDIGQVALNRTFPAENGLLSFTDLSADKYYFVRGDRILVTADSMAFSDLRLITQPLESTRSLEQMTVHVLTESLVSSLETATYTFKSIPDEDNIVVEYTFSQNETVGELVVTLQGWDEESTNRKWDKLLVYGVTRDTRMIMVGDEEHDGLFYGYDKAKHILSIQMLGAPFFVNQTITIYYIE